MARGEVGGGIGSMLLKLYLASRKEKPTKVADEKTKAETAEIAKASAARDKPVYEIGTPTIPGTGDPNYDPAQGGSLPGQPNPEYQKGMSIRQLGEIAKVMKDMPLGQMFSAGVQSDVMRPFMEKIYGPDVVNKMLQKGVKETKEEATYKAAERAAEEAGVDFEPTMEKIGQFFGTTEKTAQKKFAGTTGGGTLQTAGPGATGKFIEEPGQKQETRTSTMKEYDEWVKDPKYAGKTFADYQQWKVVSLVEAKAKAIFGKMSKEKRMALDMAKAALSESIGTLEMSEDQILTKLMELYQLALTRVHQAKPGDRPPQMGGRVDDKFKRGLNTEDIQKAIDEERAKRQR